MSLAREFLLLLGLGAFVAGLTTYLMTWVLVTVHLRDHHAEERARLGGFMFTPHAFGWFLARHYLALKDRSLNGLARMGFVGTWAILIGGGATLISALIGGRGI